MNTTSGVNKTARRAMEEQKDRVAYIDIAKALGILMVIFAHINVKGLAYQTFYSFHIPLFFILAGMTFSYGKGKSAKEFFAKKAKRLLIPYLIYALITFVWFAFVESKMTEFSLTKDQTIGGSFLQIFLAQGSVGYMQHNPALWFIPCLFLTETIYFFLSKCKEWIKVVLCLVMGAAGWLFTQTYMPEILRELPWQAGVALLAMPFMLFGNFIARKLTLKGIEDAVLKKKALSWVIVAVGSVLVVGLTLLNVPTLMSEATLRADNLQKAGANQNIVQDSLDFAEMDKAHVSMGTKYLGNPAIFYGNAILGSGIVIMLSILIADLFKERVALHQSWLVWLGERSYTAMAIHYPIKRRMVVLVAQAINKWGLVKITKGFTSYTSNHILPSLIAFVFTLIITIVLTVAADAFKQNIRLPGHVGETPVG